MNNVLSDPNSSFICLIASKKGCDSISPTVPPISIIAISFPFGHILKTFRRYDDNDFSKVESYINKKLKKYNFNKIDVQKNSKQINENLLRISNITTERK